MTARELLLNATAETAPTETVLVPELGPDVSYTIRCMGGEDRDAFELSLTALTANQKKRVADPTNYRAKLLVFSIIDPATRALMFTPNDIAAVGKIRADVLGRLADVAQRLSGLRKEDLEDAEKN